MTTVEGLVIRIRLQLHLREANRTPILYFGPPTPLQSRVNRKSEAKPINQAHEPLRNRIEARVSAAEERAKRNSSRRRKKKARTPAGGHGPPDPRFAPHPEALATRAGAGGALAGALYSGGGGGDGEASILQWCVGRVGRSSASRQEHRGFGFRYDEFGVASDGIPVSCDLMLFMCTVAAVPAAGDAEEDAGTCSKMAKLTGVFISVF